MADANTSSSQQAFDAQHLDNLTSLQQNGAGAAGQAGAAGTVQARADVPISTNNVTSRDALSFLNNPDPNTQANQQVTATNSSSSTDSNQLAANFSTTGNNARLIGVGGVDIGVLGGLLPATQVETAVVAVVANNIEPGTSATAARTPALNALNGASRAQSLAAAKAGSVESENTNTDANSLPRSSVEVKFVDRAASLTDFSATNHINNAPTDSGVEQRPSGAETPTTSPPSVGSGGTSAPVTIPSPKVTTVETSTAHIGNRVQDGYIAGATVFADANSDGALNAGEVFTISDATGGFNLVGGVGRIVAIGGTDITTGLQNKITLTAVAGSTMVTPLTTLVANIVANSTTGMTAQEATALVAKQLGLSSSINFSTFDSVAAALSGDSNAAKVFAAGVQVANTVVQAAAFVGSVTGVSTSATAAALFSSLANQLVAALAPTDANSSLLSSASTLGEVMRSAASTLNASASAVATISASAASVSNVIASGNNLVNTAISGSTSNANISDVLNSVISVGSAAQGSIATQISAAVINNNLSTVLSGINLSNEVQSAIVNVPSRFSAIAGDNVINAAEAAAGGVVVAGVASPNSAINLTIGSITNLKLVADVDGNWKYILTTNDIDKLGSGTQIVTGTATVLNADGSVARTSSLGSESFTIDKFAPPKIIIGSESSNNAFGNNVAKAGDIVTAYFTSTAPVTTATIGGHKATVTAGANNTYTASYQVQAGDSIATNISIVSTDATGNSTTQTAVGRVMIDTLAPVIGSIVESSNNTTPTVAKAGDIITATFTSTDPVTAATIGGHTATLTAGANNAYTASYKVQSNDELYGSNVSITSTDAAGNSTTQTVVGAVRIDTLAPSAPSAPTVIATIASGISASEAAATFTVTASLAGTNALAGDTLNLIINGSSPVAHVLTSGDIATGSYNYTITASAINANTNNTFVAQITDAVGNVGANSSALTLNYDTIAPAVTSVTDNTAAAVTNTAITYNVVFGEALVGAVSTSNFTATNGTVSSVTAVDSTHYTVVVAPTANTASGTVGLSLVGTGLTDAAGNTVSSTSLASFDTQAIDTLAPSAPAAPTVIATIASGISASEAATTFTVTASLAGTNALAGDTLNLIINGGSPVAHVLTSGDITTGSYNYTVAAGALSANTNNTFVAQVTDAVGNVGASSSALTVNYDTIAPVVTGVTDNTTATVTNSAITYNVVFGEALVGAVSTSNFTATNGTVTSVTAIDSTHYTVVVAPSSNIASGTVGLSLVGTGLTDAAGNAVVNANLASFDAQAIDTQAPSAPASLADSAIANGYVNSAIQTITGLAEEGSTVRIYDSNGTTILGTGTATGGAFSITLSSMVDGPHTLTAKATDIAGNTSLVSGGLTLTVDTVAPNAPTSVEDAAINAVGYVNNAIQTITGLAEVGSTVSIYDTNGTSLLGSGVVNQSGTFSITLSSMGDGPHTLTAKATDAAGNTSLVSSGLTLTVDTVAPTVGINSESSNNVVANQARAGQIITTFFTSTDSITAATIGGHDVLSSLVQTSPSHYTVSYQVPLGDIGNSDVIITSVDAADNVTTRTATGTVTIDTVAPTISSIRESSNNTITLGQAKAGQIITVGFNSSDPVTAITIGGHDALGTLVQTSPNRYSASYLVKNNDELSGSAISITSTDAAGNTTTQTATGTVTIDTLAPTVSITSETSDNTITSSKAKAGNTITASFTSTDPVTAATIGGHDVLSSLVQTSPNQYTVAYQVPLGDTGNSDVSITSVDAAGNSTTQTAAGTVTIDTIAPNAPTSLADAAISNGYVNSTSQTITGIAEANSSVKLYDGANLIATTTANGSGAFTFSAVSLSGATHTLSATATDAAGNTSTVSSGLTLTVDTIAPTVAITAESSNNSNPTLAKAGQMITASFTSTDPVTAATIGGHDVLGTLVQTSPNHYTVSYQVQAGDNGNGAVSITSTDAAGNVTIQNAASAVTIDAVAPSAPVVASVIPAIASGISATEAIAGFVVTISLVGTRAVSGDTLTLLVGDAVNQTHVLTDADINNHEFTLHDIDLSADANNAITARVTDIAGNIGPSSTALTLNYDTIAPTVAIGLENSNNLNAPSLAKAGDTITVVISSSDPVTAATISGHIANVTTVASNTYTASYLVRLGDSVSSDVSITSRDAAGNVTTQTATGIVTIDTHAPSAPSLVDAAVDPTDPDGHVDGSSQTITGTAEAGSFVDIYDGNSSYSLATVQADANGAFSADLILSPGVHTLTATATDDAGNVSGVSNLRLTVDGVATSAPSDLADLAISTGHVSSATQYITGIAPAWSSVDIYDSDGVTILNTGIANTDGSFSIKVKLSFGEHTLTATATDADTGNISVASNPLVFTVDTEPAISIISQTSNNSINHSQAKVGDTITVEYTSSVRNNFATIGGNTAAVNVIYNPNDQTHFLANYRVADGDIMSSDVVITAFDSTYKSTTQTAAGTVTIDTIAPNAPTSLADAAISNGYVNSTSQTITGIAEANSSVKLYDGANLIATTTANGSGAFTFSAVSLSGATHTLSATATDAAGNTSTVSSGLTLTVDTIAPTVAITAESSNNSNPTLAKAGQMITASFTSTDPVTAATIGGHDVLGTLVQTSPNHYTVSYQVQAGDNGNGAVSITSTDAAGNVTIQNAASAVTIDAVAPSAPTSLADAAKNVAGYVNNAIQTVTGSAEAGSTVTIYDTNGTTVLGTGIATGGTFSIALSTLIDGAHTLTAKATDAAGNISTVSSGLTLTVDTQTPVVSGVTAVGTGITLGSGTISNGSTVSLTLTTSEVINVTGTPQLTLSDGGIASYVSGSGTNTLVFSHIVVAGQAASDLAITGLNLNGGSLLNGAGTALTVSSVIQNPPGTLIVSPPPVANTETIQINSTANTGVTIQDAWLTVNDSDSLQQALVITAIAAGPNLAVTNHVGGSFLLTPTASGNLSSSLSYQASNSSSLTSPTQTDSIAKVDQASITTAASGSHILVDTAGVVLTGGSGYDIYAVEGHVGNQLTTITGLGAGGDALYVAPGNSVQASISSSGFVADSLTVNNGGTVVLNTAGYTVDLSGASTGTVGYTVVDTNTNGSGATLVAGGGNDTFVGGSGADTLKYTTWSQLYSGNTGYTDNFANFHAGQGDHVDLSGVLSGADKLSATISIDGNGVAASQTILNIEHAGSSWAAVVAAGQEVGIPDLMWNTASGVSSSTALHGASWTDIVDVTGASSTHSGPSGVSAINGASIANSSVDAAGDWTIQIKSGTATMDAANKQITFSSAHTGNEVVITDHAGNTHDITNVDKITWHG
ncbi:hypothetical protein ICN48_10935 [Polynucleobacter sp. JS-Safj-400b-B2]|uniref:Ig-like domain-containing protein n=1 Tax=Polynucleobacter sp. JS-Safj-400b-B2 TaxID=2576921 RepID=UPI001C0E3E95|nr:Ig-like domain-containing protein [Polynucleobacter sp. JS-Safj-400b-B2]MBU3626746.1 hypothetical protein [Polynucleobacter sp. JS-Safj-400b-B2]